MRDPPSDAGARVVDGEPDPARPRRRVMATFDEECWFATPAHCAAWRELGQRCDDGEASACAQLGALLLEQPPYEPAFAALPLRSACELGDDAACERAQALAADVQWMNGRSDDPDVARQLDARCRADEVLACGMLAWRRIERHEPFDADAAMRACAAGFRDVCVLIAQASRVGDTTRVALQHGCDAPDAQLCAVLANVLAGACEFPACPRPDPVAAAAALATACALAPTIDARCPR